MDGIFLTVLAGGLAVLRGAAMSDEAAERGLQNGSPALEQTTLALKREGTAALDVLDRLALSAAPGVAWRAGRIRTWIQLELNDTALPPAVCEQLVDFDRVPELMARVGEFGPLPFRTVALLHSRLLDCGSDDESIKSCRAAIASVVARNIRRFGDPEWFQLDGLNSPTRAMLLNAFFNAGNGMSGATYARWLEGHEDLRCWLNGAAIQREIARLETAGLPQEILGLYPRCLDPSARQVIAGWARTHRDLLASLAAGKLQAPEAAGYFECLHDDAKPLLQYDTYQLCRAAHPDLGARLMEKSKLLEAVWLAEHGQVREGFELALKLRSHPAGERIGAWLREHPEARQVSLRNVDDPTRPGVAGFIGGLAPVTVRMEPAAAERLAAIYDGFAVDEVWLELAWRNRHYRLYFLCMERRGRLAEAVATFVSRELWNSALPELGGLLARWPQWQEDLPPAAIPAEAVREIARGMLGEGAEAAAVARLVKRWEGHDPAIWDKLGRGYLDPVIQIGKPRP